MVGIQYITNEKGHRVAAVVDLKRYGELLEDMLDIQICDSRMHEKSIPFDAYMAKRRKRKKKDA